MFNRIPLNFAFIIITIIPESITFRNIPSILLFRASTNDNTSQIIFALSAIDLEYSSSRNSFLAVQRQQDSFDDQIIAETNTEIDNINKQIVDLHDAMSMVHGMVQEQGKELDKAEVNVTGAQESVKAAVDDIEIADDLNTKRRWKLCIIGVIVFIILVGLIVLILFLTGVIKKSN